MARSKVHRVRLLIVLTLLKTRVESSLTGLGLVFGLQGLHSDFLVDSIVKLHQEVYGSFIDRSYVASRVNKELYGQDGVLDGKPGSLFLRDSVEVSEELALEARVLFKTLQGGVAVGED